MILVNSCTFLYSMTTLHPLALTCIVSSSHIDSADEEPVVQEQPLIEEPEDEQEDRQPTTDPVVEETNPSEEGRQDHTSTQLIPCGQITHMH